VSLKKTTQEDRQIAKDYFGSFAEDYQRAFEGNAKSPLHAIVNRLFRRQTFLARTNIILQILQNHNVQGKQVVDIGCGSGDVSVRVATLGAKVIGLDIVDDMIRIAQEQAEKMGVASSTEFRVADIINDPLPETDISMSVGVVEYYQDIEFVLNKIAKSTREMVIIVDTYGPWWRRQLRYLLARIKNFRIYYRDPQVLVQIMVKNGFEAQPIIYGHSFVVLTFRHK
jgi:2-polyprenyl-3-methyl-5-hydroxy-6-metoxy-1,4-benzoquinol methylase